MEGGAPEAQNRNHVVPHSSITAAARLVLDAPGGAYPRFAHVMANSAFPSLPHSGRILRAYRTHRFGLPSHILPFWRPEAMTTALPLPHHHFEQKRLVRADDSDPSGSRLRECYGRGMLEVVGRLATVRIEQSVIKRGDRGSKPCYFNLGLSASHARVSERQDGDPERLTHVHGIPDSDRIGMWTAVLELAHDPLFGRTEDAARGNQQHTGDDNKSAIQKSHRTLREADRQGLIYSLHSILAFVPAPLTTKEGCAMVNTTRFKAWWVVGLGALILAVGACVDSVAPEAQSQNAASIVASEVVQPERLGEQEFEELSAEIAAFAGYFYEDDRLIVLTADDANADGVRAAVEKRLPRLRSVSSDPSREISVDVRSAEYSFSELRTWRNAMMAGLGRIDGVTMLDLDEMRNTVTVGVELESNRSAVEGLARTLDIPAGALFVDITGEPLDTKFLWDKEHPVKGGYMIEFRDGFGFPASWCTMAFNATRYGVDMFFTASHCTSESASPANPNAAYQNDRDSTSDFIGHETLDPLGTWCFPYINRCRKADIAGFTYTTSSFDLGRIARTVWRSTGNCCDGSKEINASDPYFEITAVDNYPSAGEWVDKVGVTTGWTAGQVTKTCVTGYLPDITVQCAYGGPYRTNPGDSGSPVFKWSGGSTVTLAGINSYKDSNNSYFSPVGGIQHDVGPLVFFTPSAPPLSATIGGPNEVPDDAYCTWQGFGSGGTAPYSYSWSGVLSGSGSTKSGTVASSGWLYLTVTDANSATANAQLYVTVDPQADECLEDQ